MAKFEVGEVVVLNTGGPDMTVAENGPVEFAHFSRYDVVTCTWLDGETQKTERFNEKLLTQAKVS
ncbi:DUF2158 domain-containing protein [Comamonas terrigena]|uniref:DUF2158 domain-containing protein n=1 Tax=Comamonas terrigena TaxID=32013 RepID=UPI0023521ABC|nr:DUF2158 domain-containing protein [Comamonas terrigena]